jgi:1-phosphofructokinase
MVYTVTFNPSLDHIVEVDDFRTGITNRVTAEEMRPGGKGINVSIVLKELGIESSAIYYSAYHAENYIQRYYGKTEGAGYQNCYGCNGRTSS